MKTFQSLNQIIPYIDDAFNAFYNAMLNDTRLSIFFENDAQIRNLVEKQKAHFTASLNMPESILKESYVKLGEFHYDIRIPYIDFIKGTEILQEHFLLKTKKDESSLVLMDEIFDYFKIMKSFTAKGYLNKMILEDQKDIDMFFDYNAQENATYLPKDIIFEKINWLKDLLHCIQTDNDFEFKNRGTLLKDWVENSKFLTYEKRNFFEDLEQRILINTQNLFYFLKRKEYFEILPLYTSLLSIYKLTLMMNNAITIEYASTIINNIEIDSLTGLFRKDLFEELIKKEIALTQRDKDYSMSIAILNINNFKVVNENFGNYSGDKVLQTVAEIIKKDIRASDMGLRIGGDEFAIIFKNSLKDEAEKVCKKIQSDLSTITFNYTKEVTFNVNIRIGISEFPHHTKKDIYDLLKSVNEKIAQAKTTGNNKVFL